MKYEEQLVYKEKSVINDLKQIGKVEIQKNYQYLVLATLIFIEIKWNIHFQKIDGLQKMKLKKGIDQ